MKKILIILLLACMLGIVFTGIVCAKATFGSWKKWDESLAPWDNKGWEENTYSVPASFPASEGSLIFIWLNESEKWMVVKLGLPSLAGTEDVFFLLTRLSFRENKKLRASIILFAPTSIGKETKGVRDSLATAEIAMVAFPPKKGKVVIRAYENKDGLFRFFEEWTIVFKNKTVIFPEKTIEFAQRYEDWFDNQFQEQGIEKEKYRLLPKLIVPDDKKRFFIGIELTVFDGKIKTFVF